MGADIDVVDGYVNAKAISPSNRLTGAQINFPFVSVGATHVMMMAASRRTGKPLSIMRRVNLRLWMSDDA